MLYIIYLCVYIHIHLFIYLGGLHLLMYFIDVISYHGAPMEWFYVYFIVYDHVHAFVGDQHSFQVRVNAVLLTLSDVE